MGAQGSEPQPTSPDLGRRRFLKRGAALGAALAAAGRPLRAGRSTARAR